MNNSDYDYDDTNAMTMTTTTAAAAEETTTAASIINSGNWSKSKPTFF
jgi:hypothetical protein